MFVGQVCSNHPKNQATLYCIHQSCVEEKPFCTICMKETHIMHIQDIVDAAEVSEKLSINSTLPKITEITPEMSKVREIFLEILQEFDKLRIEAEKQINKSKQEADRTFTLLLNSFLPTNEQKEPSKSLVQDIMLVEKFKFQPHTDSNLLLTYALLYKHRVKQSIKALPQKLRNELTAVNSFILSQTPTKLQKQVKNLMDGGQLDNTSEDFSGVISQFSQTTVSTISQTNISDVKPMSTLSGEADRGDYSAFFLENMLGSCSTDITAEGRVHHFSEKNKHPNLSISNHTVGKCQRNDQPQIILVHSPLNAEKCVITFGYNLKVKNQKPVGFGIGVMTESEAKSAHYRYNLNEAKETHLLYSAQQAIHLLSSSGYFAKNLDWEMLEGKNRITMILEFGQSECNISFTLHDKYHPPLELPFPLTSQNQVYYPFVLLANPDITVAIHE